MAKIELKRKPSAGYKGRYNGGGARGPESPADFSYQ